jgi:EF hand
MNLLIFSGGIRRIIRLLSYSVSLFLISAGMSVAFADAMQHGEGALKAPTFESVDINKDGIITVDEANTHGIPATAFKQADANADGSLNKVEFAKLNAGPAAQ